MRGISQYVPQKLSMPKYKLPWITTDIGREIRKKDHLHKKAIRSKNQQHWKAFKYQRNQVSKLVKESHNRYLNKVIGENLTENPKKFWSYVKHSESESLGIPPLKTEDGVSITDKDKAETLNSHFFSVFTHEQKPLPQIGLSIEIEQNTAWTEADFERYSTHNFDFRFRGTFFKVGKLVSRSAR